jgi:manganese/zinc/iron transport system substrate-binding protein
MFLHSFKFQQRLSLALCIAGLFCLSSCGSAHKEPTADIITTTGMIADAVQHVVSGNMSVRGLMGSGVDPHTYKATAGDVTRLRNAKMVIYNGLHLEAKLGDILKELQKPTIALGERLPSDSVHHLENFPGQHDPHIWFDVQLWRQVVHELAIAVSEFDPTNAAEYHRNAAAYRAELQDLDTYVRQRVQEIPTASRVLITAHDAFGYFGRAYGVEVLGLQGISTASEAGTQDVQNLANTIATRKIPAVFVESSVPRRHIQAVQQAVQAQGWNVVIGGELFSDAMGAPGTFEGTYIGMVKHNVDTIVNALAKGHAHP